VGLCGEILTAVQRHDLSEDMGASLCSTNRSIRL
jgi:hypothetical protein